MSDLNFPDIEALKDFVQNKEKGFILVAHRNCEAYEGMVLCVIVRYDTGQAKYQLDLEWMSFGLDFYGDTLQESYSYEFESLEKLVEYLRAKYSILVTDIPLKYVFDPTQYPDYLKDEAKRPAFEVAWKQFQRDFKNGAFLDPSLKLVYSSDGQ